MATGSPFIGRKEGVGIGIETTPGTSVAPSAWLKWMDQDIQNKVTIIESESAMGVVEKIADSAVVERWAEGTLAGKVSDESIGYFLLGMFGTVSTGTVSAGIYPHTFSVNQTSVPKALTICHVTPLKTERHSYGVIDSLELNAEAGAWVQVSAAVKARTGVTASDVPAYTTEKEFTSKQITFKTAANVAGLGAAPVLTVKSVKLAFERGSTPYFALGTDDVPEFDRDVFEAKGEFVLRYQDTQVETDFLANTIKAMELKMTNGTSILTLTASRVRTRDLAKSSDKDGIVTQTVQFYCEFDPTLNSAIVPLLNNAKVSYVA